MTELQSKSLSELELSFKKIRDYVDEHYKDEGDPLAELFKVNPKEEEIISIPELDAALEKNLESLSSLSLINVFAFTLKNIYHNYQACLTSANELIRRKDTASQLQMVQLFFEACSDYEPGHRFYTYTVFDSLITKEFHLFHSSALYVLISECTHDRLKSDEIDQLFVPAIKNTSDLEIQKKVLDVFYKYQQDYLHYLGQDYFKTLLQGMLENSSAELKNYTEQKNIENAEFENLHHVLSNISEVNLLNLIRLIPKLSDLSIAYKYRHSIIQKLPLVSITSISMQIALKELFKVNVKVAAHVLFEIWHKRKNENTDLHRESFFKFIKKNHAGQLETFKERMLKLGKEKGLQNADLDYYQKI